jgi:hypothetical protein
MARNAVKYLKSLSRLGPGTASAARIRIGALTYKWGVAKLV